MDAPSSVERRSVRRSSAEHRAARREADGEIRQSAPRGSVPRRNVGNITDERLLADWHREPRGSSQASQRSQDGRASRRAARSTRGRSRSVGADVLSFPAGQAQGLNLRINRPYGRGTTAQRVQEQRGDAGIPVRAAVYTQEKVGLRDRVRIARRWGTGLHLNLWYVVLAVVLTIAISLIAIMGPLRSYYAAWREAGELEVEYEVVSEINQSLTDDVERLNTLEGIEDEARKRGYVYPDEEAVVVEGIEEERVTEEEQVEAALDEYEQQLPWYVHMLDGILGYSRSR